MAARASEWILIGSVVSMIVLLLMITHLLSHGVKSRTIREAALTPKPNESPDITNQSVIIFESKLRTKRQSNDALIDPYSLLGLLSFGTFIFSVLYNRYKMKGMSPTKNAPSSGMPSSNMNKFGTLSQETIEQIMKVASKFLKETKVKSKNSSMSSDDYYDTDYEKRSSSSNSTGAY